MSPARTFHQGAGVTAYLARWRKCFVTGGLQESAVTPDFAPFVAARACPLPANRCVAGALARDRRRQGTGFGFSASAR